MKQKVSELEGAVLDLWVAKALGLHPEKYNGGYCTVTRAGMTVIPVMVALYSTDWSQGGPLIEQAEIGIRPLSNGTWHATDYQNLLAHAYGEGPTPLIAAMRCFVTLKFGDEVVAP